MRRKKKSTKKKPTPVSLTSTWEERVVAAREYITLRSRGMHKAGGEGSLERWAGEEYERIIAGLFNALTFLGISVRDPGRHETPNRVLKAWAEMTEGLMEDPVEVLSTTFELEEKVDEICLVKDIPFSSLCEHHLLPFSGKAHVAYLPQVSKTLNASRVVGLSKLARLVQILAKRPQVQERMTTEVTSALTTALKPRGAACIINARHQCMECRGIKATGASFITSSLVGVFRTNINARQELMHMIGMRPT